MTKTMYPKQMSESTFSNPPTVQFIRHIYLSNNKSNKINDISTFYEDTESPEKLQKIANFAKSNIIELAKCNIDPLPPHVNYNIYQLGKQ